MVLYYSSIYTGYYYSLNFKLEKNSFLSSEFIDSLFI